MATRQKKLNHKRDVHAKVEIDTSRGRELLRQGKVKLLKRNPK